MTSDVDAATSAGLIMALIQGMSTSARDGASREHLAAVTMPPTMKAAAEGNRRRHATSSRTTIAISRQIKNS